MTERMRNADAAQLPTAEAHSKDILEKLVSLGVVASEDFPYKVIAGPSLAINGMPDGATDSKRYIGRVKNIIASPGFLRQGAIMVVTEEDGIKYFSLAKITSLEKT